MTILENSVLGNGILENDILQLNKLTNYTVCLTRMDYWGTI